MPLRKYKTNQKLISAVLVVLILMPVVLFSMAKNVSAQAESASACLAATATGTAAAGAGAAAAGATATSVPTYSKVEAKIATITAGGTTGIENYKKKECLKEVLRDILKIVAKRLLAKMTESTVNWINSGFHGAPLFVENPGSFFKDIAKSEIRSLVNTIGHDSVRQPFGRSTAIGIIESFKSTFEQNSQYSLSKVTNDPALLESFRNDFSVGGWDGFLLQTQFPQNNYIGYNMMVGDELARRTSGAQNQVKELLDQGQGFLSPQVCPKEINPNYKHNTNPYNRPKFKSDIPVPSPMLIENCDQHDTTTSLGRVEYQECIVKNQLRKDKERKYQDALKAEKANWDKENSCGPNGSGLVNTTPGSVVGSQIMRAMNSSFSQTELGIAMGNSLSAIFDALLNKFMSMGLNALSSKLSGGGGSNNNDDFNYYGHTLGTSPANTNNTGFDWNAPDEVIVLSTFKLEVENAINNGSKELGLINNTAVLQAGTNEFVKFANTPGVLQLFDDIWPKTAELDMCLPGPNIKWRDRIDENNTNTLVDDGPNPGPAPFKAWVANKMNIELPSSGAYLNAVDSIEATNSKANELYARQTSITETLVKLQSIKTELGTISTEPSRGSAKEATLIRLKQRYNEMILDISTASSVSEIQNTLADAKDKLANINALTTRCGIERTAKGWANPGGADSRLNNSATNTEKAVFCSSYSGTPPVSCEVLFKTDIADYKSN